MCLWLHHRYLLPLSSWQLEIRQTLHQLDDQKTSGGERGRGERGEEERGRSCTACCLIIIVN